MSEVGTTSKHSPGPYFVEVGLDGVAFVNGLKTDIRSEATGLCIGRTFIQDGRRHPRYAECEANAQLFAAAPELLDALVATSRREYEGQACWCIHQTIGMSIIHIHDEVCINARAAIAKARGESR